MSINPDEMLLTARQLVDSATPSQADLRRAVSTAYYSMFHKLSKTATERFLGSHLNSAYKELYRSFSHQQMKQVCEAITAAQIKQPFAARLAFNVPTQNVQDFARGFIELQQNRHEADYNPRKIHNFQDSSSLVQLAEDAIAAFSRIPVQEQNAILICMLLPYKK